MPKWIANVCLTPTNHQIPKRLVIEAESEADARQTLQAEGYTSEFRWVLQSFTPYIEPKGKIVVPEFLIREEEELEGEGKKEGELEERLETHFSEHELKLLGDLIARGLHLKRDRAYPDRWQTTWGTKTGLGLLRMLDRMIEDIKGGQYSLIEISNNIRA